MSRMTLSDRITIEAGLYARKSLTEIAKSIHKSRQHVSKEIQRNGTQTPGKDLPHAAAGRRKELCEKRIAFILVAPTGKWTARRYAEPFRIVPVNNLKDRRMYAMNAQTRESANWTESTTLRSRQTPGQNVATHRRRTIRGNKVRLWLLWTRW